MKEIKQLFKKANKDRIELESHRNALRNYLLDSKYFAEEKKEQGIDFKIIASSMVFSVFLIVVAVVYFAPDTSQERELAQVPISPIAFDSSTAAKQTTPLNAFVTEESFEKSFENVYEELIDEGAETLGSLVWNNQQVNALKLRKDDLTIVYYFNTENNLLLGTEALDN